jgi:dGTPase
VTLMTRQRELLTELVVLLCERPEELDTMFAEDWADSGDDAARQRVVLDQVASLTDASAVAWHARLS